MAFFHFGGNGPAGQGDPQPHVVWQQREKKARKPRKAIGSPLGRTVLNLAVTLLVAAIYYYVELPALNLHSGSLYVFVILLCAVYCGMAILTSGFQGNGAKGYFGFVKKQCKIPFFLALAMILTAVIGSVIGWKLIRAADYRELLAVETGDFASEVEDLLRPDPHAGS